MSGRSAALDRTRTALPVLVVIHHAIIPYTYYGHADAQTWLGFDGIVLANDSFFMAGFFFLSGLFVWPSLRRKTTSQVQGDRALRLALPFAVAALLLMPLAYYALELRRPDHLSLGAFWWKTVTVGPWPSGPVWFVWVLLMFDVLAATIYRIAPDSLAPINRLSLSGYSRPVAFFVAIAVVTTLAYVPMRLHYGVSKWFEFGPLSVQASRLLLYAACFMRSENSHAPLLDAMQSSAYGIFLIHYLPVLWMQHWLLGKDLSAFTKAGLYLVFGLGVSWFVS